MNKERLLDLADIIENDRLPNVKFDMTVGVAHRPSINPECGTAACIAGYALCAAFGNKVAKKKFLFWGNAWFAAKRVLGLSAHEASRLFEPYDDNNKIARKTRAQAVKVLRHAAETGEINWSVAE